MIDVAIKHLADELNQYLKRRFDLHEDIVVTSNMVELDGTIAPQINNKVILCLAIVPPESRSWILADCIY